MYSNSSCSHESSHLGLLKANTDALLNVKSTFISLSSDSTQSEIYYLRDFKYLDISN